LLKLLAGEGRTILAVLHDLPNALDHCDHIALMDAGRIVAFGTSEEILFSGLLESVFGVSVEYGTAHYRFVRKKR